MIKIYYFALLSLIPLFTIAQDKLTLIDGPDYYGRILSISDTAIRFRTDAGDYKSIPFNSIDKVKSGSMILSPLAKYPEIKIVNVNAGTELVKASNLYYSGMAISLIGVASAIYIPDFIKDKPNDDLHQIAKNKETRKTIKIVGSLVAVSGVVINLSAFAHIKIAGKMLDLKLSNQEASLSYNF